MGGQGRHDGRHEATDLVDLHLNGVAGVQEPWWLASEPDTIGGSGGDHIARPQGQAARRVSGDLGGREDHIRGASVLHHLTVDPGDDAQPSGFGNLVSGDQPRPDGAGEVGVLAQRPLVAGPLEVTRGQIVEAQVAQDGCLRLLDGRVAQAGAEDESQFALPVQALLAGRNRDGTTAHGQRGRPPPEQIRPFRNAQVRFRSVRGVIAAGAQHVRSQRDGW